MRIESLAELEPKKLASLLRELGRRDSRPTRPYTLAEALAYEATGDVYVTSTEDLMIENDSYRWNGRYWAYLG